MLRIGSIVWGVGDVSRAVDFWGAALGYRLREEPEEDWAVLVPPDAEGQQIALMQVAAPAEDRRRHHLDLYAEDQQAEVRRLKELGASDVDWHYEADADYVVLADPDGNYFCVVQR